MELQLIQNKIHEIRGQRVMLDFDLATLYEVETKRLKEAVRRNLKRFPADFMFELSKEEWRELVANCVQLSTTIKHASAPPFCFTEHGVTMLSGVLRSDTAIAANVQIVRAFVAMKEYISSTNTITAELAEIRSRLKLVEHDTQENLSALNDLSEDTQKDIDAIYAAIAALSIKLPEAKKERVKIGFKR